MMPLFPPALAGQFLLHLEFHCSLTGPNVRRVGRNDIFGIDRERLHAVSSLGASHNKPAGVIMP
jgi:hypothetical protein